MASLGDFVYVQWDVSTQYGTSGTITGQEYTTGLAALITAGYGRITTRPANWNPTPNKPPWVGVPATTEQTTKAIKTGLIKLKELWAPYSSELYPANRIVTDAYQDVNTLSTVFPDGYLSVLWNSDKLNKQGQNWVARNPSFPEQGCFNQPTTRSFTGAILDTEFEWQGDTLAFMVEVYSINGNNTDTTVYVSDDQGVMRRVRAKPLVWSGPNGFAFRILKFTDRRTRRVRFTSTATFYQVLYKPGDAFRRAPDRPLAVSVSDSYREASGMKNASPTNVQSAESYHTGAINDWYQERTGWALARLGQGGTGYWNNATGAATDAAGPDGARPFFSDANVEKIKAHGKNKIRILDVNGTINDGYLIPGATDAERKANHKARVLEGLNKVYTWDPGIRIVIWGPEPYNDPQPNDRQDINRQALKEAAEEHPAVIGFIDPAVPGETWWSGTGSEAAPNINSSQARMLGQDGIHYNYEGGLHYAALGMARMGEFMIERERSITP